MTSSIIEDGATTPARVLSTCACCGSTRLQPERAYACADPEFERCMASALEVLRCAACGLAQADLAHLDAAAFESWRARQGEMPRPPRTRASWRWLEARSRVLSELSRRFHDGGEVKKVFQLGAGPGLDLVALQRVHRDAECWVDQLDPEAESRCLLRVGDLSNGPFDRVLVTHELGRATNPVALMRRAVASMRRDGLLIVEVANDLEVFLDRRESFEPQLTFFTVHTLSKFFATNFGDDLLELHLATAGPRAGEVHAGGRHRRASLLSRVLGHGGPTAVDASDDTAADDRALVRIVLRKVDFRGTRAER